MSDTSPSVYFGGPDLPPRALRDLLKARVEAVPAGGEIVWATYYFRDRDLADALIAASRRGVRVHLAVEGSPRRKSANRAVIERLAGDRLGGGLHVHAPPAWLPKGLHPHLHTKIYYFSHPQPCAFVGSFNPSGDEPEDPDVIAEIGDQDRGHNMLVELRSPTLAGAMRAHVLSIGAARARFRPAQNRAVEEEGTTAWFYPRLSTGVIDARLVGLGAGDRISGAISHLTKGALVRALAGASARGAVIRLLVHDTARRVPEATVAALKAAGMEVRRYVHPEGLPVHSKVLLIDRPDGDASAWFGSFNYNPRSRWLNQELLLQSRNPAIVEPLRARFETMFAQ